MSNLKFFFAATCGQNLFANESLQQFSTPNWPSNYPLNQDCFWIITSESNEVIEIQINEGALEADNDFIEVRALTSHGFVELRCC